MAKKPTSRLSRATCGLVGRDLDGGAPLRTHSRLNSHHIACEEEKKSWHPPLWTTDTSR